MPSACHSRPHSSWTPRAYLLADGATEALIYAMVVFSPWAFGCKVPWAIWTMNVAGYSLGILLMAKWLVRWQTGYAPARWDNGAARWPIRLLAALTVILVAWCLVSAVNARATVIVAEARFEYREWYIPWLPHSYDAPSSWFAFWQYMGLAWSFWAIRDWLLGKTRRDFADAQLSVERCVLNVERSSALASEFAQDERSSSRMANDQRSTFNAQRSTQAASISDPRSPISELPSPTASHGPTDAPPTDAPTCRRTDLPTHRRTAHRRTDAPISDLPSPISGAPQSPVHSPSHPVAGASEAPALGDLPQRQPHRDRGDPAAIVGDKQVVVDSRA